MRHGLGAAVGVMLGAMALSGAPVFAQEPAGVSSQLERTASTTPQEKLAFSSSANAEIAEALKTIGRLIEQSRGDANAEVLQCLTSRQTAVRALQQVSTQAEGSMQLALAAGESEKADHEYRKTAVALSKSRMMVAEANGCVSEGDLQSGQTMVDWNEDGSYADQDETQEIPNDDELDVGMDPPDISPFL